MSPQEIDQALALTADQLGQASAQLNQVRGTLQAMGDPAALAASREELEEKLARNRRQGVVQEDGGLFRQAQPAHRQPDGQIELVRRPP